MTFTGYIRAFFSVLHARRALFICVVGIALAGVVAGVYLKKPVYESTAGLLVRLDHRSVSVSRSDIRRDTAMIQAEEAVASQVELLQTQRLREQVLDALPPDTFKVDGKPGFLIRLASTVYEAVMEGINRLLITLRLAEAVAPRYKMLKMLNDNLRVYPVRKAQIILVSFRSKVKKAPPIVLDTLIRLYLEEFSRINAESEGYKTYTMQALRLSEQLVVAEKSLLKYKTKHDIANLDQEKRQLVTKIDKLRTVLESTEQIAHVASVTFSGDKLKPVVSNNNQSLVNASSVPAQISQLTSNMTALRLNRVRLLATLSEGHGAVRAIDRQITETRNLLLREARHLGSTLEGHRGRLNTLLYVEPELNRLERQVKIMEDAYEIYRKAAEDRRFSQEQEAKVVVQVVDPPSIPYTSVSPSRVLLLIAGGVLALCVGAIVISLVEYLQGMLTRDEPETLRPKAVA